MYLIDIVKIIKKNVFEIHLKGAVRHSILR